MKRRSKTYQSKDGDKAYRDGWEHTFGNETGRKELAERGYSQESIESVMRGLEQAKNGEAKSLGEFSKYLVDLEPEFAKVVDEEFWNLIDDSCGNMVCVCGCKRADHGDKSMDDKAPCSVCGCLDFQTACCGNCMRPEHLCECEEEEIKNGWNNRSCPKEQLGNCIGCLNVECRTSLEKRGICLICGIKNCEEHNNKKETISPREVSILALLAQKDKDELVNIEEFGLGDKAKMLAKQIIDGKIKEPLKDYTTFEMYDFCNDCGKHLSECNCEEEETDIERIKRLRDIGDRLFQRDPEKDAKEQDAIKRKMFGDDYLNIRPKNPPVPPIVFPPYKEEGIHIKDLAGLKSKLKAISAEYDAIEKHGKEVKANSPVCHFHGVEDCKKCVETKADIGYIDPKTSIWHATKPKENWFIEKVISVYNWLRNKIKGLL